MYTIYVLAYPETKRVFYVGYAACSAQYRLLTHIAKAKRLNSKSQELAFHIKALDDFGLTPLLGILEETNNPQRTHYWISELARGGHPLLNKRTKKLRSVTGVPPKIRWVQPIRNKQPVDKQVDPILLNWKPALKYKRSKPGFRLTLSPYYLTLIKQSLRKKGLT